MGNKQKLEAGFTIIEVMIVLVIAGLIIVIVLLAVPALQRSSRNTQRKHDAESIGAAVADFIDNNGQQLPNNLKNDNGDPSEVDISSTVNLNSFETAKVGYYNGTGGAENSWGDSADNVFIDTAGPVSSLVTPAVVPVDAGGLSYNKLSVENVGIIVGESCNDSGTAAGTLTQNAVAIFYVVENGINSGNLLCLEQ